jgi:hypothetical protein
MKSFYTIETEATFRGWLEGRLTPCRRSLSPLGFLRARRVGTGWPANCSILHQEELGMARPTRDDSLLLKSAESLGRMIGALQRQLDTASRRLAPHTAANGSNGGPPVKPTRKAATAPKRKAKATKKAATKKAPPKARGSAGKRPAGKATRPR